MESINKEVVSAPPLVEAVGQKERLINKEATGAQVLMLLGLVPEEARTLDKEKIKDSAEKAIPLEHKEKIKKASFNERKDYWEGEKDAMVTWRKGMDAFLDVYKTNNTDQVKKDGLLFLQKILKKDGQELGDVKIDADNIYDTFMKDGEGDVEFFARRIADNKTITFDEIEKNQKLINNLGNIYGANSAKISELLTHGIANYKQDSEAFIASAQENINKGYYGEEGIWTVLDTNSKNWDVKVEAERLKKEAEAAEQKKKMEEAAAEEKRKQEALKEQNEKKNQHRSLEKDKDGVEDAYNIVANQDTEKIKEEWKGHQKFTVSALNEPVVIDEEVIRDYKNIVLEKAKKTGNEVPFYFVEDRGGNRIIEIFVGEANSSGSADLNPTKFLNKNGIEFAKKLNEINTNNELYEGKARFLVGVGHTHPKGFGPIFSAAGEGDFGADYGTNLRLKQDPLYSSHASSIEFVGAPDMGLLGAIEAKPDGAIEYHPINISELKEQEISSQRKEPQEKTEELSERTPETIIELSERMNKSSSELIKKFVPLLKTLEKKPDGISDEDYDLLTKRAFHFFTRAEEFDKAGKGKEEQVNELLVFYDGFNKLHDLTTLTFPKNYYKERLNEFETILKKDGIEKINVEADKDFDSNMMNDIGVPVEDKAKVGKVLEIVAAGFIIDNKPLRKALVKVGTPKEILGYV